MNPEAGKLRRAMMHHTVEGNVHHRWLVNNADTVAELVDAAMDVAASVPSRGVGVIDPAPIRRLGRAVVDFKGPQQPPEPDHDHVDVLRCPHHSCMWWVAKDRGSLAKYQGHYREAHLSDKDDEFLQELCSHTAKPIRVSGLGPRGERQYTRTVCRDCGKEL